MASNWISYNDLAWTEDWFVEPEDYKEEVESYVKLLSKYSKTLPKTLLHFGSGAGGHDQIFKKHFDITGVDLSLGMLSKARNTNPEVNYIEGDMRSIKLNKMFDAVIIPDSIDYMTTVQDLKFTIDNSVRHLKSGGLLLISCKVKENFRNNNFVYTGEKNDINITLFENNFINKNLSTYEATFVYLIRKQNKLEIFTENQTLGLFPLKVWEKLLSDFNLSINKFSMNHIYDKYLLNDGEYKITLFLCQKK